MGEEGGQGKTQTAGPEAEYRNKRKVNAKLVGWVRVEDAELPCTGSLHHHVRSVSIVPQAFIEKVWERGRGDERAKSDANPSNGRK